MVIKKKVFKSLNIKKNSIIAKFDELNSEHGKHGLDPHNRKFIYDPIYNLHIPISFDSMVVIKNCKSNVLSRWKKTSDKNKTYYKEISKKYNSRVINKKKNI